jgi:hypothetical protein
MGASIGEETLERVRGYRNEVLRRSRASRQEKVR